MVVNGVSTWGLVEFQHGGEWNFNIVVNGVSTKWGLEFQFGNSPIFTIIACLFFVASAPVAFFVIQSDI